MKSCFFRCEGTPLDDECWRLWSLVNFLIYIIYIHMYFIHAVVITRVSKWSAPADPRDWLAGYVITHHCGIVIMTMIIPNKVIVSLSVSLSLSLFSKIFFFFIAPEVDV